MLKVLRAIFGGIVFSLSVYSLITAKNQLIPYILFFFAALAFVVALSELKEKRNSIAVISFLVSALVLFVFIDAFNGFH